ncbi:hypothetical protein [Spirosoma fluminis]
MDEKRITKMLERAMTSQLKRYSALSHPKRATCYGRWLYNDIRSINELLLSRYQ